MPAQDTADAALGTTLVTVTAPASESHSNRRLLNATFPVVPAQGVPA